MIDAKDFDAMRKEFRALEERREETIQLSRGIIQLSKRIIYSVHRDEFREAAKLLAEIKARLKKLRSYGSFDEGHFRTALQEYVEAAAFYSVVVVRKLPSRAELDIDSEHYLLGLCDLGGELVRRAVNAAIRGRAEESLFIKGFLEELYGQFLLFDFRNGELRRKFDGIKYDLRKLEDLSFDLSRRK